MYATRTLVASRNAGAVEIDLALRRHELAQSDQFFFEAMGFDADGIFDALHARVVVAMAADICDDYDAIGIFCVQSAAGGFAGPHALCCENGGDLKTKTTQLTAKPRTRRATIVSTT